ncbi:hypothetical protein V8C37DRAFT_298301 [Trichoderma ceciliae]
MPRPTLPPTPGSSSDIRGKDGIQQLSSLQLAFELPPPAIHDADASRSSPVDSKLSPISTGGPSSSLGLDFAPSPKSLYPMQAAETVKSRRRSSTAAKEAKENTFTLPPPPTRSRKIIQMKPRSQNAGGSSNSIKESAKAGGKSSSGKPCAPGPDAGAGAGAGVGSGGASAKGESKKKQPSATSAAGRKIARKTAHSLIERRRRSKMNEEFALLKSMIPACTGEMHKLAILQASIEYVRYLEDCVAKLKAQQEQAQQNRPEASHSPLPPIREFHPTFHEDPCADVEMTDSEDASPVFAPQRPSLSPALHAQDSRHRQHSYSSASTDQRHYSYSGSTTTSPAFGPQHFASNINSNNIAAYTHSSTSASGSTLTSPALLPQSDLDQEATAALLMLNSDRRGTANNNGRALSVRDLLSS